jgi:LysM repeat protein
MPLPSRDELQERLAAISEAAGVAATEVYTKLRRTFEERPVLGRAVGGGAAVLVFTGVVIGVVAGQPAGHQSSTGGQLVVPAVTATPRADEHHDRPPTGAPPEPGHATHRPHAAPPPGTTAAPHAEAAAPTVTAAPTVAAPPSAAAAPSVAAPHLPAAAAVPGLPERAAAPTEYRVRTGETLAMVALRYGVPFEQIASDSGLSDPNRLYPGQRLVIRAKPADVEVIQPGRTLGDYARSTGRRLDELMRLNPRLVDPDRILAGGRLDV